MKNATGCLNEYGLITPGDAHQNLKSIPEGRAVERDRGAPPIPGLGNALYKNHEVRHVTELTLSLISSYLRNSPVGS